MKPSSILLILALLGLNACFVDTQKSIGVSSAPNSSSTQLSSSLALSSSVGGSSSELSSSSSLPENAFVDARDGQVYTKVLIGSQTWMGENLNYGRTIPSTSNQSNDTVAEKYCYNNEDANCKLYGGLYQWHEAMGIPAIYDTIRENPVIDPVQRGICPAGWHMPTHEEWQVLQAFLGGEMSAGVKMMDSKWGGSNSSGFGGLAGGGLLFDGYSLGSHFEKKDIAAVFWSASAPGFKNGWEWYVSKTFFGYPIYGMPRLDAYSVRCIMD